MKILRQPSDFDSSRWKKVCLAIGVFDGVHLGHQQVIRQTVNDARYHDAAAVVVTFDRHPSAIVAPERAPRLIYSLSQKLDAIASLEPDAAWLIEFDKPFSEIRASDFIERLVRDFGPLHSVCVGTNFTFGHRREGNVALLNQLGQRLHFTVHGLAALALDGHPVSSTRIRQAIANGDLDAASQMLGRPYGFRAKVIRGDQLGRTLGFATANLDTHELILPPRGVYAAQVRVDSAWRRAVINIGHRPTLRGAETRLRVEAHLLDFSGDLYDRELETIFLEKLREEKQFASLDDLKKQIAADILDAGRIFAGS
jgi:riboflavin kinase/FMN adenylyltransferase